MQATTKPSVPTSPIPAGSTQNQQGPSQSAPQPLAPDALQQIGGGLRAPGTTW